uniref:Dephospho-CoA kinase n=1 Tax=Herpetomonas muscarum TaxID=5718 RepID=T1YTF4_HERMU|nr:dephospho-CoA kinase [Herpetomonas muscarum]
MPLVLIGLTGGIACGKSSVSAILADEHHIPIIDADLIVRELQAPGAPCTREIGRRWPECVDPVTGQLRREVLGRVVFADAGARRELAGIMNGPIFRTILSRIFSHWWRGLFSRAPYVVVLDAPTLFETKLFTYFVSGTVVVACSQERQLERLAARNKMGRAEAMDRINSQMPLARKRALADLVIENDAADDMAALAASVRSAVAWMGGQGRHRVTALVGGALAACVGLLAATVVVGGKLLS